MDIFESKNITPMLISQNIKPFDSEEYIYELKLDGIRCLAYLCEDGMELLNKRNKRLNSTYPELKSIYKQVKCRCILDGELVLLKEGVPDFFELQRRSLMSNPLKIELMANKLPVCFTAFDILYYEDKQITDLPLLERKSILSDVVKENGTLAVSRFIEKNGIMLFNLAKEKNLEGIVGKKKVSKYYTGKRTKDWVKMKALLDEDFVICGFYFKEKNYVSVILGQYDKDRFIYQSHVAMGVSHHDFLLISGGKRVDKNKYYVNFPDFCQVVWLEPDFVCCVQYMERTPEGGLRQPVFRGIREDKLPMECVRIIKNQNNIS